MTDSVCSILGDIRARYRGVPILTLAQTALWDDPLKAMVKGFLDDGAPGARLVLGVMDTDYFSRLPKPPGALAPFDVLAHNDGTTRDLWAAVGEMSCLLGAETPLPVHKLAEHGVRKGQVAAALGGDCSAPCCTSFIDAITEAWGWRGLAQTQGRRLLAGDVRLSELKDPLLRQVDWALAETAKVAGRPLAPFAAEFRRRIAAFVDEHPEGNLADLYLAILPFLYETLLGREPAGLEYTRSSELLSFNRNTANRARFRPLDLFLNPDTRPLAAAHYNEAVRHGGIATLDRFGDDAIPFEVAIPGHGRGTLHLTDAALDIDTDEPVTIELQRPVRTRRELAVVLEERFGPDVALLGKAVVLITMLAGEYIFLFNETGSPYVTRSCHWNALLGMDGIGLNLYPIMRLGVRPLDTIGAAGGEIALPPHMASVFGTERLPAPELAATWRAAASRAEDTLRAIQSITRPADWLVHLASEPNAEARWKTSAAEHRDLRAERFAHGEAVRRVNALGEALIRRLRVLRAEANALEMEKGRHFRACVWPVQDTLSEARRSGADTAGLEEGLGAEMERRQRFVTEIADRRSAIARVESERAALAAERRALTDDPAVGAREARLRVLEGEAEREKARRIRDAWMTAEALRHTQPRPTAWWFPAVDASGAWFSALTETAALRWQSLMGGACSEPSAGEISESTVLSI
ncbi:MAG TPA: hypothetical protein VGM37_12255 [Armatimonadota bacterium]